MPVDSKKLLNRVKTELRIVGTIDDARLCHLIDEAVYSLQTFKRKTLVDTVTDATAQAALSPLDIRYVILYVAIQYDGSDGLDAALAAVLEQVREK
jgi:hypothetical protein